MIKLNHNKYPMTSRCNRRCQRRRQRLLSTISITTPPTSDIRRYLIKFLIVASIILILAQPSGCFSITRQRRKSLCRWSLAVPGISLAATGDSSASTPPDQPASYGAALLNNPVPLQPHRRRFPAGRYSCDACAKRFDKLKQLQAHLASRGHAAIEADEANVWEAYQLSGEAFFHPNVSRSDATRACNLDAFADGLPERSRSLIGTVLGGGDDTVGQISPKIMLSYLPSTKRASMWRYIRYIEPRLKLMVSALPP